MTMTTYQQCYAPSPFRSPVRFLQLPSIVSKGTLQQPPRQFPIEPVGPKRQQERDPEEGPVLGLGTKCINTGRFLEPKEITGSPSPSKIACTLPKPAVDRKCVRRVRSEVMGRPESVHVLRTKFGLMDSNLINRLAQRVRWTSTSTAAAEEACLKFPQIDPPSTTLEKRANMVRSAGQRYDPEPMEWQRAVFWDFVQSRGVVHHDDLSERTYSQPEKLLLKRLSKGMGEKPRSNTPLIRRLVKEDQLSSIFVRQCPGYSGFVPRTPTESKLTRRPEPTYMVSTMKANYRELPLEEYRKQSFARKGPLSKTVTLTYPFNPYNKV
ncbi:uncharacterized protein LOC134262912 [Saccostrea cucullata]|uniref:uncharacterized protein LOC134262912 n=1 Tax=Saccostrea cuccullata TaxID=36930 RepID=UPI002ED4F615